MLLKSAKSNILGHRILMIMTVMKIKMMIKMVDSSISPSPPGGNQVDGLPPAVSNFWTLVTLSQAA